MKQNEITGTWRIVANGYQPNLQLWRTGNTIIGRVKFDEVATWKTRLQYRLAMTSCSSPAPGQMPGCSTL